ncbi:MAG TPA: hypothetical protein VF543_19175 [Pyrinomonadaceae bacterium]|jgi:putative lipoprotein
MRLIAIRFLILIAFTCLSSVSALVGANQTDRLLRQAIIRELGNPTNELRFVSKRADLNGDGRYEVLVWVPTQDFGGTGGYPLLIFSREKNGYRLLWKHDQLWTPLVVLRSSSHGWQDLVLQLGGGGEKMQYVVFRHNGKTYSDDFRPIATNKIKGQWLIGKDWKMSVVGPLPN